MIKNKYYITTTAPYVNADPHIGFALEIVQADVMARYKKLMGYDVAFGFGTDEHGLKIYRKAIEEKKSPQEYCDFFAKRFDSLKILLNLSTTHFIRTTDAPHIRAAQEFWMRCFNNGDIYKKNYRVKYCVGCELEKTDSELVSDRCPIHPNMEIDNYEEENYFFKFSKYEDRLLKLYKNNSRFVLPAHRQLEINTFVKKGLQDFSVSRLKTKMPWGIEVPNDDKHVMYVWFDALIFYISNIGWPHAMKEFEQWWPVVQIAGKDNLRQQSAIWQAMLMSAGIQNSKQIIIHGFITSNGKKMSKSLGNVVDPFKLINKYGVDPVRYYLLKEIPSVEDGDYSDNRMKEIYNSDLANELGNLVSRITTLAEKDKLTISNQDASIFNKQQGTLFEAFDFNTILDSIWVGIKDINKKVNDFAPWNKSSDDRKEFLENMVRKLHVIGQQLLPFIPTTSEKIIASTQGNITKAPPLFPRLK